MACWPIIIIRVRIFLWITLVSLRPLSSRKELRVCVRAEWMFEPRVCWWSLADGDDERNFKGRKLLFGLRAQLLNCLYRNYQYGRISRFIISNSVKLAGTETHVSRGL